MSEIIEEIEYTTEQIKLFKLLKSFGMSDESITVFIDNGYDTESLKIIERHEVETLLLPPVLADRTKCLEGLNNWRKSLCLKPIIEPLSSIENRTVVHPIPTSSRELRREQFTASFLIHRSDKGKQILSLYREQQYLQKDHKKAITHIVVDEFKDKFGKLTHEELMNRSRELSELFPSEENFSWYKPTFSFDPKGKRIRLCKYPTGSLYDRNNNYKPILSSAQNTTNLVGVVKSESTVQEIVFSPEAEDQFKKTKLWLRHNEDEWDELKTKWESSSSYRLYEAGTVADGVRLNKLLSEYPVLRNPQGYSLVELDFKYKYPGKEEQLYKSWPQFRQRIIPIFEADVVDARGKALLKHLLNDETTDDCCDSLTFALLAHLLPSSVIYLKKGSKRWKPSFAECREAYLLTINNLSDIETDIQRQYDRCKQNDTPRRPFLIGIGSDFNVLEEFLVYYEDVYYRFKTFLKALDVCFKLFKAYDLQFPREATGPWNLISQCLYGMEANGDYNQSKINRLIAQLRSELDSNNQ